MRAREKTVLIGLAAAAVVTLILAPFMGMTAMGPGQVWPPGGPGPDADIFWRIRVPRVCGAFLAGASLAVSGMAFQAMFRNPLATPFTLGVASGASLGAAVAVWLGLTGMVWFVSGSAMFAFGGALGAIGLVYGLTRVRHGFSTATMLLAGIAVSLFCSSLILFLQYLSDFTQSFRILRWLMGGLEALGGRSVRSLVPFAVCGGAILATQTRELNLLLTGDDLAAARGVDVPRTKRILFFGTSLMVGAVVAVCGPIGFVGMMAPHICRLLVGANHRALFPATWLFGGAFLVACDTLARTLIAPAEIPVGVVTALLGGPFFVWLLLTRTDLR